MTARPVASLARTMFPSSTSLSPIRPLMGASIRQYESCSLAFATRAGLGFQPAIFSLLMVLTYSVILGIVYSTLKPGGTTGQDNR